jgi:hypothetical protein
MHASYEEVAQSKLWRGGTNYVSSKCALPLM